MKRTNKNLGIAAVASMVALGGPGLIAVAAPSSSSTAEISLTGDCVVESSKDISYVEYLADGEAVTKDEPVDTQTFDLTQVEGVEDYDTVNVKAGTTVETLSLSGCSTEDLPTGAEGEETVEEDEESSENEEAVTGPEEGEPRGDGAVITLAGCVVESSKDISYVEYLADGEAVLKDESMNTETYDLTQVEGIEEYDAIEVKSSTTVEEFAIACDDGGTTGTAGSEDSDDGSDTDSTVSDSGDGDATETDADADDTTSEETEADDSEESTVAPAQAQGHNGHGDNDERHDGRHEKWGGESETTEDDTDAEESDEDEVEDSGAEETEDDDDADDDDADDAEDSDDEDSDDDEDEDEDDES